MADLVSYYCSTCVHRSDCADAEFPQNGGCDHYRNENASSISFDFFKKGEKNEIDN